jgi:hypothetical protein
VGEAHAKAAVDAIRQAVATGFDDRDRLRNAPALEPIRNRDDFRAILKVLDAASGSPTVK